jgi:SAM-dependent methyltransferase
MELQMTLAEQIGILQTVLVGLFVAITFAVSLYILDQYRWSGGAGGPGTSERQLQWLSFSLEETRRFSYVDLALISLLGLFLEMLLIRWVSSEIRIFAYFKNFVLIACYLGFGLGCYLSRQRVRLLALLVPLVLITLLVHPPWAALRSVMSSLPTLLGVFADVDIWGVPQTTGDVNSWLGLALAIMFTVPVFALLVVAFIPIGQLVGWYLEHAPNGIPAYTVNVLGSLAGILLYSLICFAYQPPAVWLAVAGLLLLAVLRRRPRLMVTAMVAFAVCVAVAGWNSNSRAKTFWSPYQKLVLEPGYAPDGELARYDLTTNDSWYQKIIDLSPEFVNAHGDLLHGVPIELNAYNLPYRFYPDPPSTLVLGAGMGNDVAAALRNGSRRVVAVEIDPMIIRLGRAYHFEQPYQSNRVTTVVDDARSYIQNAHEQFDLINFCLLDSHTTASHFSNIRIDNYVYTSEALEAAKKLLKPDGIFIVKFQANKPWIAGRLKGLLTEVFGRAPLEFVADTSYSTSGNFFVAGSSQRIDKALADPQLRDFIMTHGQLPSEPATLTTDNWPYFYQHEPGLPASVLVITALLVVLSATAFRRLGPTISGMQWHFFFLGAGFLLMEVQIVSKMALLFGTTWLVNSIVISGLLLLIVVANVVVDNVRRVPTWLAYAGLFSTMLVGYVVPGDALFFGNPWVRGVIATAVLSLPVFFAGIVFIQSFAEARFSSAALGSNLFGALVGGLLESLSLWTGLRSLLVLAALLYLASLIALGTKPLAREVNG